MIRGTWYPKGSANRKKASLIVNDSKKFSIMSEEGEIELVAGDFLGLAVSDRVGNIMRRLTLPDQSIFETLDNNAVDACLKTHIHPANSRSLFFQLESSHRMLFLSFIVIIALGISLKWSVPWASGLIAESIPQKVREHISRESLIVMDAAIFKESETSVVIQKKIKNHFENEVLPTLSGDTLKGSAFTLHFRKLSRSTAGTEKQIDIANAFAFPSGDIIVTDELIRVANNQQEIDVILYHEIAHVLHNHGLKQVIKSTLVTTIFLMLTDGASFVEDILLGLPVFFIQSHYSKIYETEADKFAFELMLKNNINPTVFSDMLSKISIEKKKEAVQVDEQNENYFSTHPATSKRLKMAKKYAEQFSKQRQP